jgi:hypothetical protein
MANDAVGRALFAVLGLETARDGSGSLRRRHSGKGKRSP